MDFHANYGEIVGVFGLVGAGRTELARVLFGIDKSPCGTIMKDGKEIKIQSPSDAIENGIGLVPEDRKTQGLIIRHDVLNNLTLVKLRELPWVLRSRKQESDITADYIRMLSIATSGQSQLVGRLRKSAPSQLSARYKLGDMTQYEELADWELFEVIGKKRGFLISGGEINYERTSSILLDEFRAAKIGRITLELPPEA